MRINVDLDISDVEFDDEDYAVIFEDLDFGEVMHQFPEYFLTDGEITFLRELLIKTGVSEDYKTGGAELYRKLADLPAVKK